ncbi:MAG: transcriptional regulator NrdR [Deltaproteobacteria bacterium]
MKCPFCAHSEDKVIDSRISKDANAIRRRRECLQCSKRFTTYEYVEEMLPTVVKKDGRRELIDIQKIHLGIAKACEKRPIPLEKIKEMEEIVATKLCHDYQGKEVFSSIIGDIIMEELHKVDGVAYVRFASVYREFRDINDFMGEIKSFLEKK